MQACQGLNHEVGEDDSFANRPPLGEVLVFIGGLSGVLFDTGPAFTITIILVFALGFLTILEFLVLESAHYIHDVLVIFRLLLQERIIVPVGVDQA